MTKQQYRQMYREVRCSSGQSMSASLALQMYNIETTDKMLRAVAKHYNVGRFVQFSGKVRRSH